MNIKILIATYIEINLENFVEKFCRKITRKIGFVGLEINVKMFFKTNVSDRKYARGNNIFLLSLIIIRLLLYVLDV